MAGIELKSKGGIFDGNAKGVCRKTLRSFVRGILRKTRDDARADAPVDKGTFRRSIIFRSRNTRSGIEGEVYSTDVRGKVLTIEHGFPARRPGLKGRVGRHVFARAYSRNLGLLRSQSRVLDAELSTELTK